MLAAFERDGNAALATHEFRRADAVARVGVEQLRPVERGAGRRQPLEAVLDTDGIGLEPALHQSPHAQAQRERLFFGRAGEGLQRASVVGRAQHGEGFARCMKRMQVEQGVVIGEQRTQHVRDAVLEVLRLGDRTQVAVEVAVA